MENNNEMEIKKVKDFINNTYAGGSIFGKVMSFKVIEIIDDEDIVFWPSIKYYVKVEVIERKVRGFGYIKDDYTYEWNEYNPKDNKTYTTTIEIDKDMRFSIYMNNHGGKAEFKIK